MSVSFYPFYSFLLKLQNKRSNFSFPPLKLSNKGNEEYSKIIIFIYFHSISFTLPKWELNSSTQFKWILLDNFPKKHVMTLAIEYIVQEKQKLKVMSKIKKGSILNHYGNWKTERTWRQKTKTKKVKRWGNQRGKKSKNSKTSNKSSIVFLVHHFYFDWCYEIEGFMAPCHIIQPIMFNFTLKPMLQPIWINYD